MPGETAQPTIPTNGPSRSPVRSHGPAPVPQAQRRSHSSPALEAVTRRLPRQPKLHPLSTPATLPPTCCNTPQVIAGAPDAALPPALPPLPPTLPLIAPPLVPPLTHAATDATEEGGMDDIPGRGGAPTHGPGAEEPTEEGGHGGDTTGHSHAPMTGTGSENGTETETGTWVVASQHADAHGPALTLGRGTVPGPGGVGGLQEGIGGGSAAALAPPSPPSPAAPPPPHTEEARPLPLLSVTS